MSRKANLMCIVVVLLITLSMVSQASGAMMTYAIEFSASEFAPPPLGTVDPPTDDVFGSFIIFLDPTMDNWNLPVSDFSINIALGSEPASIFIQTEDKLIVGGQQNLINVVEVGTDDFYLVIEPFLSDPTFKNLTYSSSLYTGDWEYWRTVSGSVKVTAVPLPPSLLLLGSGLLSLAAYRRKKLSES